MEGVYKGSPRIRMGTQGYPCCRIGAQRGPFYSSTEFLGKTTLTLAGKTSLPFQFEHDF